MFEVLDCSLAQNKKQLQPDKCYQGKLSAAME